MTTFKVVASAPGLPSVESGPIVVSAASGTTPNPALLPAAVGAAVPSTAAFTALPYRNAAGVQQGTNPRNMTQGQYFNCIKSGLKIWRLTTDTFPVNAASSLLTGVDYAEGANRIGRPALAAPTTYPILCSRVDSGGGNQVYLLNFDIATGGVTLKMLLPGSEAEGGTSLSWATPNVMYVIGRSGAAFLRKYDISGASPVEITGGVWPHAVSGYSGRAIWFQQSADDRWFSWQEYPSGPTVWVWDSQTNTTYSHSFSGMDEHKLDLNGRYVWVTLGSNGPIQRWDPVAGTFPQVNSPVPLCFSATYVGHCGVGRKFTYGADGNCNPSVFWRFDLEAASPAFTVVNNNVFYINNLYSNHGWVDQPNAIAGNPSQYGILAWQGVDGTIDLSDGQIGPQTKLRLGDLGMFKLDGSDYRLLCCGYSQGNVNGTAAYYANALWPNWAPDGKFVVFNSNMRQQSVRNYAFAVILPVS